MKQNKERSIHFVVENLIKIMNDNKLTKTGFSEKIGMPEPKWNKISNGKQSLSVSDLSKIAENLRLREIDIYTYPKKYIESKQTKNEGIKTQLTIELKEELKDKVLELVFGDSNLEILNNG
ncbi:MAG: helix-turn-helix domain-containing protein [Tannerellaceae bacterium]|jgi:DNA-binding Xre family transcriptional regulator|nr:helix-turn-helix domain-containing protein [Tannerellaceae bacterium]